MHDRYPFDLIFANHTYFFNQRMDISVCESFLIRLQKSLSLSLPPSFPFRVSGKSTYFSFSEKKGTLSHNLMQSKPSKKKKAPPPPLLPFRFSPRLRA